MRRSLRSSTLSRCIYAHPALPPGGISPISPPGCVSSHPLSRALHAMATLQVYQAKVLKHLHERGSDQGAMEELRTATDFALRATKVMARSLGQVMSTIVVHERHLWLTLAQIADVDKSRFLDAPISQGGLFGDTAKDFTQQFSAVQEQTEAIKHILPRRDIPTTRAGSCCVLKRCTHKVTERVTVSLSYAIQFARHPPRYRGVLFTSVHSDTHAAVLRAEEDNKGCLLMNERRDFNAAMDILRRGNYRTRKRTAGEAYREDALDSREKFTLKSRSAQGGTAAQLCTQMGGCSLECGRLVSAVKTAARRIMLAAVKRSFR
ncbi:Glutamate--tRNA ligase 2 [Labeo rohita]|uniref:Glutamate--tRNA ligase 2 n=1 Tax=Labeo rohita TaxID=84645 RepID=A0ABQ8L090_LABRO|nr:Glutamate--tRNA ligase 2 [Labeo rohita]